jgi:hypothetical protein
MPKKADLKARKIAAVQEVVTAMKRYDGTSDLNYLIRRWVAQMTAVEIHGAWERYAESRLVVALNHNPKHLISGQSMVGVSAIPTGLARYIVRGGKNFFDFRSMSDLIKKADTLLGKGENPFRIVKVVDRSYIDCLAAIRNHVVHGSETSLRTYKQNLRSVYGIKAAPEPTEFLHAMDYRRDKPLRLSKDFQRDPFQYRSRLSGLAVVVIRTIATT